MKFLRNYFILKKINIKILNIKKNLNWPDTFLINQIILKILAIVKIIFKFLKVKKLQEIQLVII